MIYQFSHFGLSEYFCKEQGKNFSFPAHLHHSFEIIVVMYGEMDVTIENNTYTLKKNESVLIFPNQVHSLSSNNSEHMLCIFSPELVKAYSSKIAGKKPTQNSFKPDKYLIDALNRITSDSSSIEKKGILYSICAEFDKNVEYDTYKSLDENLLYKIFEYVEKNFENECSLRSLSNSTGYSYSYLSRLFKRITGASYNSYVNQYRISNACYLLHNTNNSILQCAIESGYKSLRSFNRNFMSFLSVTPKEYRDQIKKD